MNSQLTWEALAISSKFYAKFLRYPYKAEIDYVSKTVIHNAHSLKLLPFYFSFNAALFQTAGSVAAAYRYWHYYSENTIFLLIFYLLMFALNCTYTVLDIFAITDSSVCTEALNGTSLLERNHCNIMLPTMRVGLFKLIIAGMHFTLNMQLNNIINAINIRKT